MSARSVVVVMPFGGDNRTERRRAILNFKRLEYLVRNKCNVTSASAVGDADRVVYAVEVAKTAMDDIPENALQQIETADILIALIVERNPNVIYEVAYRRARDGTVVLVVDSADNLPLYLKSLAHQSWKQDEILARINQIANDEFRELSDFTVGIPDDLKKAIDVYDGELQKGLEEALQEIEAKFEPHPNQAVQHLRGIVSDQTSSFYPCSIVEVGFSGRNDFANTKYPAIVRDFDEGFSRLYGYVDKRAAEADRPLTLDKLLGRIEGFSDKSHWEEFMQEQVKLTATVVKEYGFARAKVPLRINKKHPRGEYCGTSYLPCIVAQVIDGELDGPHKMYLLVVYIEVPDTLRPD
jgi:hypothetical protein